MGESEIDEIGNEPLDGEIPERRFVAVAVPQPRADMDLVDRDRRGRRLPRRPIRHPLGVVPAQGARRGDDRCSTGRHLGLLRHGIGLLGLAHAARTDNVVLIAGAGRQPRHEQFPDARGVARSHGMTACIPCVEVADHGHALGVGRPDREAHAFHAFDGHGIGAKRIGQLEMASFVEQMQVKLAQHRTEGVRVLGFLHRARPLDAQQIGRRIGHGTFEQARHLCFHQSPQQCSIAAAQHLDRLRPRQIGADAAAGRAVMRAEHLERIAMARRCQRFSLAAIETGQRRGVHESPRGTGATRRVAMRARPLTGMASQVGRLAAS